MLIVPKLIITADDYGMSPAVNNAIEAGIEAGLITSTNVMTNMDYYKDAINLKKYNSISVGIHFTLTCGKPVSEREKITTLVSPNGIFYNYREFRRRYRLGLISNNDIRTELIAQYKRFKELLGNPDYWNTHQNVHVDFRIFKLFVDIACELGINKMRSHQRIYVKESNKDSRQPFIRRVLEPFKVRLINEWQKSAHKKGIASPNGLIVCLNKSDVIRPDHLFTNIEWKNKLIGEYVIHPATKIDSPFFGRIVDQRIREYEIFTDLTTLKYIKEAGLVLKNYNECILE